jgi:hypothetical protein
MKKATSLLVLVAVPMMGVLLMAGAAFAHHGFQVAYDTTSPLTKKGVVTHLQWTNPHCQIYFDVKEADGKTVNWGIEMTNPRALVNMRITPDLFPEGKTVEITFSPARSGVNRGLVRQITVDGKKLFDERRGDDAYAR